ncbi:hypothetical protein X767_00800 [Mesorhizobium sp. LSJC264A00]|nr:hypothetical protein X767_00800 [Mesorhizobium sp. LSJC264A00]
MLERRGNEIDAQAQSVDQLGCSSILGDLGGQRADTAIGIEHRLVPQHALALGKAEAKRLAGILPARLQRVEERAFDLGPEAFRPRADRRRADKPGIGPPGRHQVLDVIPRHQHVGIRQNNPMIARRFPALDAVVELRVAADAVVADQQPGRHVGKQDDRPVYQFDDGIVGVSDAEDQFVARPVEREGSLQRLLCERLHAARRHDDRDRWLLVGRRGDETARLQFRRSKQDAGEIGKKQSGGGEGGCESWFHRDLVTPERPLAAALSVDRWALSRRQGLRTPTLSCVT